MISSHGISDLDITFPKDAEKFIYSLRLYGGVFSALGDNDDPKGMMALIDYLQMTAAYALSARNIDVDLEDETTIQALAARSDEEIGIVAANLKAVVLYAKRLRERLSEGDNESALIDMFLLGTSFVRADMIADAQVGAATLVAQVKGGESRERAVAVKEAIKSEIANNITSSVQIWRSLLRKYRAPNDPFVFDGCSVFFDEKKEDDFKDETLLYQDDGAAKRIKFRTFDRYVAEVKHAKEFGKIGLTFDGEILCYQEKELD